MSCINLLENLFDFSWLCGNVETVDGDDEGSSSKNSPLNMKARFVNNVWSGLEYEEGSTFEADDSFDNSLESRGRQTDEDDDNDDDESDDEHDDDNGSDTHSIHSCQEPQEHNSNMPVLRQLPSFGSTLASNSFQSGIHPNGSGLSPYPTRSSSLDSASRRSRFFIKPLMAHGEDEESSTFDIKSELNNKPGEAHHSDPTNSFIFMRQ